MPNTEVKLSSAENTWMETSWEDREVLAFPFMEKRPGFRRWLRKQTESEKRRGNHRGEGKKSRVTQIAVCSDFQTLINLIKYSPIAQSVERVTVNHDVVGSSPTWGAKKMKDRIYSCLLFFLVFN